jgi:adrenodoxin-NADP+ reductase
VHVSSSSNPPPPFPGPLDLPLSTLRKHYTHLLLANGCTVPLLHPALPPGPQTVPALQLVQWYTQHPAAAGYVPPLDKTEHVSIVGQGNVALDIARMLLAPVDYLAKYDVPTSVLDVLAESRVKHVSVIGRRGPYQAAFTTKEVRELMHLANTAMVPIEPVLLEPPQGIKLTRQQSRIVDILRKGSTQPLGSTPRSFSFDFFRSPTGMLLHPPGKNGLQATLSLAHTELDAEGRAVTGSATSSISTSLVVGALGHRAEPTAPWYDPSLGHIRNVANRVIDEQGRVLRNVYASGWAATGARGVLASTMRDAHAVADVIISDHASNSTSTLTSATPPTTDATSSAALGASPAQDGQAQSVMASSASSLDPPPEIQEAVRQGTVLTYDQWKKIDDEELRRGEAASKERERMGSLEEAKSWLVGK